MNTAFRNYVLTTLTAKKGRIASFLAGVALTFLVRVASDRGLNIPKELLDEITVALPFAVAWVIDFIVLQINATGVKQIQETLHNADNVTQPVKIDGVPGVATQDAVAEAVDTPNPKP